MTGLKTFTKLNMHKIPQWGEMSETQRLIMKVVSQILPFKVNEYVCNELIDWANVPDDPMFQLTFPQRGMLSDDHFNRAADALRSGDKDLINKVTETIQRELNPHPSGQVLLNSVSTSGPGGIQHKYRETVLFFPQQGQTCHSYCSYCFRWPQFVKLDDLKFASKEADELTNYLRAHRDVTDVLFTGGDPMVMSTAVLRRYIEPLLTPEFERINIRIGTKSLSYWPQRFVTDPDAADTLYLFEEIVNAGRHLAIMAHYSHPVELSTEVSREALRKVQDTGAIVRGQAPLINHVNDDGDVWAELIKTQVKLGVIPYYLFVERDTGAKKYFELPLAEALDIYNTAYRQVSGLGKTIRGPVMSATPGKVLLEDVVTIGGKKYFALRYLQTRGQRPSNSVFFAEYDEKATWFDDLRMVEL